MYLNYNTANKKYYERFATDYYFESEKANGTVISPLRSLAIKKLINPTKNSGKSFAFLKKYDVNYVNALKSLELAYDDFSSRVISLYDDSYSLIAHTTMVVSTETETGKVKPYVTDIIIKEDESITDTDKYDIYRKILEFYEHIIGEVFPNVELLDVHTYALDGELWQVLKDLGYNIQDAIDLEEHMVRFTKLINERTILDGGNTTLK